MNAQLAVKPQVKSIDESRAEIFALFDAQKSGGCVWNTLTFIEKKAFCTLAGVTITDLNRPLAKVNQFDRRKLFIAVKSMEQVIKKFASVSLQDFT